MSDNIKVGLNVETNALFFTLSMEGGLSTTANLDIAKARLISAQLKSSADTLERHLNALTKVEDADGVAEADR